MTKVHEGFRPMFSPRPGLDADLLDIVCPPEHPFGAVPPEALRPAHIEAFLGRMWGRILQQVRNPAQVMERADGTRQVQVLGAAVFAFDSRGIPTGGLWRYDAEGRARLETLPPGALTMEATPHRFTWLSVMKPGFRLELAARLARRGQAVTDAQLDDYVAWAFDRYESAVKRHCDLRLMRHRIGRALRLDPFVVSVARRIRLAFGRPGYATFREYAHVVREREAYGKLVVEAPHLLALFAACAEARDFPPTGEPLARLSGYLRRHKRSARLWRLLANARRNPIRLVGRIYRGSVGDAVLDYLRLLDELGFRKLPPDWLVWEILQVQQNPNRLAESWWEPVSEDLCTLKHIARWIEAASDTERARMRPRLHAVLACLIDAGIKEFDGPQRKAGWKWLDATVADFEERWRQRVLRHGVAWPVPFEGALAHGAFEARAIANDFDLWEEGRAMHHCIDLYSRRLQSGTHAVFSVRESATGRRVATILLRQDGGWRLRDVTGFANRAASTAVMALAHLVVERAIALSKPGTAALVREPPGAGGGESGDRRAT